jgi:hypothetical protein
MATKLNIIVSNDCVWATYVETICYKQNYKGEDSRWEAIKEAQSSAFSYGLGFGNVYLDKMEFDKQLTDSDIFELLKKQHNKF